MMVELAFEMAPVSCGLNSELNFHGLVHIILSGRGGGALIPLLQLINKIFSDISKYYFY